MVSKLSLLIFPSNIVVHSTHDYCVSLFSVTMRPIIGVPPPLGLILSDKPVDGRLAPNQHRTRPYACPTSNA